MKIASLLEDQKIEKRISITPEVAKKYIELGFDVNIFIIYNKLTKDLYILWSV